MDSPIAPDATSTRSRDDFVLESDEKSVENGLGLTRPPLAALRTETGWSQSSATTFAKEGHRRDTVLSSGSSAFPPRLERQPTWKPEAEALHGYPMLAAMLGTRENYAIYRSFAALNSRNLLYHQAKLTHLEHEMHALEQDFESEQLHYKVEHLFADETCEPGTPVHRLREKYKELSHALDKYNHLLLQQAKLHSLSKPDGTFVESIWNFINSDTTPNPNWLKHPENTAYAIIDGTTQPLQDDLVTLNRAFREQDPFAKFFTSTFLGWWHSIYSKFRAPDGDMGEYIYGDKKVSTAMRAFVMVIASALPTCSIVALYFIQDAIMRLLFIVLFSAVFASALTIFTEARSIDVFTASVALASVQVVFVGTAFGNGNDEGRN
ncbi:hypothetical protein Slin15195_G057870 [Septoria linicola]|uniref:DUF6594 domain-containing protein n=1 Tax=Septoria linicola TaxID=215465 RepID=A0A9Q9AUP7_9PEZI|nr:hypothetical protein Slin14017_G073720 [Septoria linicola]USW52468.1 hypothetical protein Slin15195_G057870 [Septoria linicola]